MKRLLTTLLVGAMTILLLTACSEQAPPTDNGEDNITTGDLTNEQNISGESSVAIFRGIIDEITENTAIVVPNSDQEHILSSGDKVKVNLSVSDSKFAVGDEIVVYYTGEIMESYPLQIDTVDVELAEDLDQMLSEDKVNADGSNTETNELLPTAKIAINIEGVVTEVDGNRITLDNGQIVIITEETLFETENIGNFIPVDDDILVGNYLQGFTLGDSTASEVTADVISMNGGYEVLAPPTDNGEDNITTGDLTNEQNISGESSVAIFRGIIDEVNDSVAIVIPNSDQGHILSSGDKVKVNLTVSDSEFAVGDEIVVYYTGEIMESYPLQIDTVDVELAEDLDQMLSEDNENTDSTNTETNELLPTAKIAINIEGVVTEVDGNRITLDNGQTVIITDETLFETENIGNFIPVYDDILVGNYLQGFTFGDSTASEVTADVISMNGGYEVLTQPTGSMMVNIEGIITEVSEDGNSFLLDNGKWIEITKDTELGITGPNAAPKDEQYFEGTFRVGNSIAGFTEDINAEKIIAYALYTNWNWENPIKDTASENDFEIIETEIIINVTSQYDGTLNDELKEIGIISVENIFDLEGTVMYLVKTEAPVEDVITKLQGLSYVNYAEYNMSGTFIDPIFEE